MEAEAVSITALSAGNMHQIFNHLLPKDLCCVSATCKYWKELSHDQASNKAWKQFYEQRWLPVHAQGTPRVCWQTEYGSKMKRVSCWGQRHYQQDSLYGHSSGVCCLRIIKGQGLVATGAHPCCCCSFCLICLLPLMPSSPLPLQVLQTGQSKSGTCMLACLLPPAGCIVAGSAALLLMRTC